MFGQRPRRRSSAKSDDERTCRSGRRKQGGQVPHHAVITDQVGRVVGLSAAVGVQRLDPVGVAANGHGVFQPFPVREQLLIGEMLAKDDFVDGRHQRAARDYGAAAE